MRFGSDANPNQIKVHILCALELLCKINILVNLTVKAVQRGVEEILFL